MALRVRLALLPLSEPYVSVLAMDHLTTVVNMRTTQYDVAIDRSSLFGNPFHIGRDGERITVLEKYRQYFLRRIEHDLEFRRRVLMLRGKKLGCHCVPKPCHGMIIAEWLETNAS